MKKRVNVTLFALILMSLNVFGQEPPRIDDPNRILWVAPIATFKLNKKFDLYTEYQFRRDNWGADWMQSQVRVGLQYNHTKDVSFLVGYSEIETFPYGDPNHLLTKGGKQYSEQRIYEQIVLKAPMKRFELQHRYRFEQRFIEKQKSDGSNDGWRYVNRIRYMCRANIPFKGNTIDNKEMYGALAEEIFIGFGKKVKLNIFDQNRFSALIGYKANSHFRIEGGFFSQIQQLGSPENKVVGKVYTIIQYNTGAVLTAYFNFDLSKKDKK